jgi:uncharacterized protein (TIGR02284 family)
MEDRAGRQLRPPGAAPAGAGGAARARSRPAGGYSHAVASVRIDHPAIKRFDGALMLVAQPPSSMSRCAGGLSVETTKLSGRPRHATRAPEPRTTASTLHYHSRVLWMEDSTVEGAHDEVISTLNELIQACTEARDGFRNLAANVGDADLNRLFTRYSEERGQFLVDLQTHVRRLGGDPPTSGTVAASLQRGWMTVKAAVTGGDDTAILGAAQTGEESAEQAYENALRSSTLPVDVRSVVECQYSHVKAAHHRVRQLWDIRRAA